MMSRTLPPRQFSALQILAGTSSLTVTALARYMHCDATTAKNAAELLKDKGLATALDTSPRRYAVNAEGRAALAAELAQEA